VESSLKASIFEIVNSIRREQRNINWRR